MATVIGSDEHQPVEITQYRFGVDMDDILSGSLNSCSQYIVNEQDSAKQPMLADYRAPG